MKTLKSILKLTIITSLVLAYNVGCKSKFEESSPDQVISNGKTLQERIAQKKLIDERLIDVTNAVDQLKKIVNRIKQIQNSSLSHDVYTPLDFILDINSKFKNKVPESRKDRDIIYTNFTLPFDGLSEDCKRISASLESEEVLDDSGAFLSERATYSIKSCSTNQEYLSVAQVSWVDRKLTFSFNSSNFDSAVGHIAHDADLTLQNCQIDKDDKHSIEKIDCKDVNLQLSNSEKAVFAKLTYSHSDNTTIDAYANIYENETLKAKANIQVFKNGEVNFDLKKVDEKSAAPLTNQISQSATASEK